MNSAAFPEYSNSDASANSAGPSESPQSLLSGQEQVVPATSKPRGRKRPASDDFAPSPRRALAPRPNPPGAAPAAPLSSANSRFSAGAHNFRGIPPPDSLRGLIPPSAPLRRYPLAGPDASSLSWNGHQATIDPALLLQIGPPANPPHRYDDFLPADPAPGVVPADVTLFSPDIPVVPSIPDDILNDSVWDQQHFVNTLIMMNSVPITEGIAGEDAELFTELLNLGAEHAATVAAAAAAVEPDTALPPAAVAPLPAAPVVAAVAPAPTLGFPGPAAAPKPTAAPQRPRPANRQGQTPGWPQALKHHKSRCDPTVGCRPNECLVLDNFPAKHQELSTTLVKVDGKKVPKLWAHL